MMSFANEHYQLAIKILDSLDVPPVSTLHLPQVVENVEKPDEFGFVFLADGSVGPFYTSLDDTLPQLWARYPHGLKPGCAASELLAYFASGSQVLRSLALGAFNALSQHVMRRSGYFPKEHQTEAIQPRSGDRVAFVGYIRPMIEELLTRGHEVLVLEKNPARVEMVTGLTLSTDSTDLAGCNFIFCTASTLINDTLAEILRYKQPTARLCLVGPSGSGLPDVLFRHGVDEVGGIFVEDVSLLNDALEHQQSWSQSGYKYQLAPQKYPGVDELIHRIAGRAGK